MKKLFVYVYTSLLALLVLSLFSYFSMYASDYALRRVEVLSVYCKKEIIDQTIFIHREDIVNSEHKEIWSIDGKQVSSDEYEEFILDAQKELIRRERRQQEENRKRAQEFKNEAILALNKKILRLSVKKIEDILKKFDNHNLQHFFYFDDNFSSNSFDDLKNNIIPEAKKLMYSFGSSNNNDSDSSWDIIHAMVVKIDGLDNKLESFYQDTIKNAIEKCDDTKILKELLELVSQV